MRSGRPSWREAKLFCSRWQHILSQRRTNPADNRKSSKVPQKGGEISAPDAEIRSRSKTKLTCEQLWMFRADSEYLCLQSLKMTWCHLQIRSSSPRHSIQLWVQQGNFEQNVFPAAQPPGTMTLASPWRATGGTRYSNSRSGPLPAFKGETKLKLLETG